MFPPEPLTKLGQLGEVLPQKERCKGRLAASGGDLAEAETRLGASWLPSSSGHGNLPRTG